MGTQLLTNFGAPTINGIAAQRILSNQVLENMYQGIIEDDGHGVTQRFTTDCSGAEIRFIHVKPIFARAREIGASINGGNFPTLMHEGETDSFGLPVLTALDDPIDLSQVSKDMIPVDLLIQYTKSYTDQVNNNINAMTIAGKYSATYLAKSAGNDVNITEYAANGNMYETFLTANSLLDEGVEDMGVAMFPQDDRAAVYQASYRPILLKNGILNVGGANYGYDIARKGAVDAGSEPRKNADGFIGYIDGVPVHVAAPLLFKLAAEYLGLERDDVKTMIGYVSSAFANVRGIAATRDIKVIDNPLGQGVRLQPLTRMGFKVVEGYEKGNSLIVKSGALNVYDSIKTLFTLADYTSFSLLGPASRIDLSGSTLTTSGTTKVTLTSASASKAAVVGVVTGTKLHSVAEFIAAYNATGAKKAIITTLGTEQTVSGLAGMDCYGLVYAADGTCALVGPTAIA